MGNSHLIKKSLNFPLFLGTIGVVFGDIGTSPLYALRETLTGHNSHGFIREDIYSVLSLIFWTIMFIVSFKYVTVIMRADNNGERGSLALLTLVNKITTNSRIAHWATFLGFCGAVFFSATAS